MYVLSDGDTYIGVDNSNVATRVTDVDKALTFSDEQRAKNYRNNLKSSFKKSRWNVVNIESVIQDDIEPAEKEDYIYEETQLERDNIDIYDFFLKTIQTMSQLKQYIGNMYYMERQYNQEILDVRHYKRDVRTKLNAIQLQRLEQFEIQLERERHEYKQNRIIAEVFYNNYDRLENVNYLEVIKRIRESEYKPKILTYEFLDEIVGKK